MTVFGRSHAMGILVPLVAAVFAVMLGNQPVAWVAAFALAAGGAWSVGRSVTGVVAGVATTLAVGFGGMMMVLANADF